MHEATELENLGIEAFLEKYRDRSVLRFLTCGSVDDGKSTLIGRMLHDARLVFDDHLEAIERDSARYGTTGESIDLALLVDGLKAEREQGITIDVAWRYFSTARRRFIIADTPGHEQYTRNMATGASHCQLAILLVDARYGVVDQTRRHAFICSLLGIRHLVLAINKMDLVDFDQAIFERIRDEFTEVAARLQADDVHFIPVSALTGDNVVHRSEKTPWYTGATLLHYLEDVHVAGDRNLIDLRFPVQRVVRPHLDFRGFAGTLASGILRKGAEVVALPSGRKSRVKSIVTFDGELEEAVPPMAVTVTLEDELDLSRGDLLAGVHNAPRVDQRHEAMIVWMAEAPLNPGGSYLLCHQHTSTPVTVTDLRHRIDVNSLHREPAERLELNGLGRVAMTTLSPLTWDPYARNKTTGAFILIDRLSNATVACGMLIDRRTADEALDRHRPAADAASHLSPPTPTRVAFSERTARAGHRPFTVWLTGLPRSGKSTQASALERRLFDDNRQVVYLDGERLRTGLSAELGFSQDDRRAHARRAAHAAKILNDAGFIAIIAMVTPEAASREEVRRILGDERYVEVYLDAPVEACEARDTTGLYAGARAGEIARVTGVNAPFERPEAPQITLDTVAQDAATNGARLYAALERLGLLDPV